ncbi:hypothetical protein [Latilactobacillus sakei]|uniref:hypothetical protein n=1 Tax=Latilactobacillus sakei TaxID=1599 RepID=UPI000978FDDB|nr:hypothetical protein [Latilactobacillus sakei]
MTVLQRKRNRALTNYINCDWADLPENDINKIREGLGIDLAEVDNELEFYRYRITQGNVRIYFESTKELLNYFGIGRTALRERIKRHSRYNNYLIERGCWDAGLLKVGMEVDRDDMEVSV